MTAHQPGNATYDPAPDVLVAPSTIAKVNQTITFDPLPGKTYGDPSFTVVATATSSLPVTFTVSGACSNSGREWDDGDADGRGQLHGHGAPGGQCQLQRRAGCAADVQASPKASQTITFDPLPGKTYGDPPFTVVATATSGLPVTFTVSGACSNSGVNGPTVTLTGVGSCTVTAHQAGNANYNAAPDVPRTFSIAKASQTITFNALPNKTFGDPPFVGGDGDVGPARDLHRERGLQQLGRNGTTVRLTGVGSCTVTAHQAGNANYNAAPDVPRTFSIAKASQTITFNALPNKTYGDPPFTVVATATSGLAVTFTVSGACTTPARTVPR